MKKEKKQSGFENLPGCAAEYIRLVIKKMRWQKKVRGDVQAELIAHFEDALKDCKTNEEREKTAKEIISEFGDAKMLAILARRAKKRCRPLWQKILIRSFQIIGIIILYIEACNIYINSGKPNISVNYVEWLNKQVRAGRDESLNSAPLIKRAVELYVNEPNWLKESKANWPSDFNEIELKALKNCLAQNAQAFETLSTALKKPNYWNIYDTNQSVISTFLPSIGNYRKLAMTMIWQIKYLSYNNNLDEAVDKAIELCDFGQRMEGNGTLVEQLVGMAIESKGLSTVFEVADKSALTPKQLIKIQNFLQIHSNDKVIDLNGEKVFFYDFVQQHFTDDGKGGGKPFRRDGTGLVGKNRFQMIFNILTFNLPDKKEVIKQIDNMYDTCQKEIDTDNRNTREELHKAAIEDLPILLKLILPADEKVAETSWRLKTERDALIGTVAILRYHNQFGRYPDSFNELLIKGFINRIPYDTCRNGPLTYRKTEDNFILYSYGENLKDDGGKVIYDEHGRPQQSAKDDSDRVFWPVVQNKAK
jgi:hypothetical protein